MTDEKLKAITMAALLLALCTTISCSLAKNRGYQDQYRPENARVRRLSSGRLHVLTYNVAGLPEGVSSSHPIILTRKISPLLNDFDLALVQEDFYYHRQLASAADHAFISSPGTDGTLGDGLARFSRYPMGKVEHTAWKECHGTMSYANDCLTPKGFSFATHEIAEGVYLDVYNLHMDAGGAKGDQAARSAQMDQLIEAMEARSAGKAVIVAGDFNLSGKRETDLAVLDRLIVDQELIDSCRALSCGKERIDRVLFRGSDSLELEPVEYQVESERFVTSTGWPLSDHNAVSVMFVWKARAQ